jgi:multiple antibiotic resistance protein
MLAGPGSISLLIAFQQEYTGTNNVLIIMLAILAVGISVLIILRGAPYISRLLGASGINAVSRIVGFIVISIGVEYIMTAVLDVINRVQ